MKHHKLAADLASLVGAEHVLSGEEACAGYAHDRLPYANFRAREGALVGTLPGLVVQPGTSDEVVGIVRAAAAADQPLIVYGGGSGVLGGIIPLGREITLDMQRMNRILNIDSGNNLVTVQAGMNGGAFEEELNAKGYTSGHLPQSLTISTVGGWAACRGGGQESSRYGKIEDIVLGLKAILPDGQLLEIRPLSRRATGPSIRDLIIGSEGTLAIITELTLRIWQLPEAEEVLAFALPDRGAALALGKRIMQAGLHPRLVRLYDEFESAERTAGIAAFADRPCMANIVVCGLPAIVAAEAQFVRETAAALDAVETETRPFDEWRSKRYVSITKTWQDRGYFNDTIEVVVGWTDAEALYNAINARIRDLHPKAHFGAHWSHVYPESVCQYMTVRLPPTDQAEVLPIHGKMWEIVEGETLAHGGSIAHHHGTGLFRGPWMEAELGAGMDLLRKVKAVIDPGNVFNPGKLGLPTRKGAIDPYRDRG